MCCILYFYVAARIRTWCNSWSYCWCHWSSNSSVCFSRVWETSDMFTICCCDRFQIGCWCLYPHLHFYFDKLYDQYWVLCTLHYTFILNFLAMMGLHSLCSFSFTMCPISYLIFWVVEYTCMDTKCSENLSRVCNYCLT